MSISINSGIITTKTKKTDIEKIDFCVCAEPTQTLDSFYKAQTKKPDILINGGLFTFSTGKSVMDFIDEGKIQSAEDWIQYGLGIDYNNNLIYGKDNERNWKDFLSAYPPLVVDGGRPTITMAQEIAAANRRTILGYNDEFIYTITIDTPVTLTSAAEIAQQIGCTYAINLDGGGSTRLLYQGQVYAAAVYNRPVDNVVAIYFKTKVIYRVQTGAFSLRRNAENYQEVIRNLPDNIGAGYKNAYIRLIDGLYKVQVGAFSVEANAVRVMNDLKSKGYNAFITTR